MLADGGAPEPSKAGLRDGLHRAGTQFLKLIEFIAKHLPRWRDDVKRKAADAEDMLSEQLCDYLNNEARNEPGVEAFQFQREARDDAKAGRNLDVAAKPVGDWLRVGQRHYSIYDTFLPIECKRLPMPEPKRRDRDAREYLYDQHKSAGGIQRFKSGQHGSRHEIGAMIGYVQQGKCNEWCATINDWVVGLHKGDVEGWSSGDRLSLVDHDLGARTAILESHHCRTGGLCDIEMKHLWIEM